MKYIVALVVLTFVSALSHADGLPFQGNRYAGNKIVFELTERQIEHLDRIALLMKGGSWSDLPGKKPRDKWFSMAIELSRKQQDAFKDNANPVPKRVVIWDTRKAPFRDCGCAFANEGFRFSRTQVEVPTAYLMPEKQAFLRWSMFLNQ
jgi:hypothetical protein